MRIIIVDDHKVVRDGIRFMLSDVTDIEVVAEADAASAMFDLLAELPVDVVLLDIQMPETTGLVALEQLSADFPQVRVLMLSMHDQSGYVRRALELGAAGYLPKSSSRDELVDAIQAAVEGQTYIHRELVEPLISDLRPGAKPVGRLSPREHQVLQMIANGSENKQVARELGISEATVKTYVRGIFERLDVNSRAEAVAVGLRLGVIE
jgi:DNA-binding NarL/FixJ family response regulator